jgi:hypothetical protein
MEAAILRSDADRYRQTSAELALEGVAVRVTAAILRAGVRTVLLKGPALSSWLYADEARAYSDVDLLIAQHDQDPAERVLEDLGFVLVALDVLPHDRPHHARTWVRPSGAAVDLHHTLVGVGAPSDVVWSTLTEGTEWMQLGEARVEVLSLPARALVVVLHAAQHGLGAEKPLEDLTRTFQRLSFEDWKRVRGLAERLEALPSLGAGLRLLPAGRTLAARLELAEKTSVETVLRSESAPTMALGFDWLSRTSGVGQRTRFLARKLVPQPAFMRAWSRLARRGRIGLAAAYGWRVIWLLIHAGPAYLAWRKARAETRRSAADEAQDSKG